MTQETNANPANVANAVDPNSPAAQIVQAAVETIASPNPVKLVEDIALAVKLANEIKSRLSDSHPSVLSFLKSLF